MEHDIKKQAAQIYKNCYKENQMEELRIIRAKEAQNMFGMPKSTFYNRVNSGLIPPSISLGGAAVGWILSELNAVMKAMIRGESENDIKQLVSNLQSLRVAI